MKTTRATQSDLHAKRRAMIGNTYPTNFGGEATVISKDGDLYKTKSGCLWTLADGVLISYYGGQPLENR